MLSIGVVTPDFETGRVELVLHHEFQISKHLDGVLQHLRKRATPAVASVR